MQRQDVEGDYRGAWLLEEKVRKRVYRGENLTDGVRY
jgi:hypothetical protein